VFEVVAGTKSAGVRGSSVESPDVDDREGTLRPSLRCCAGDIEVRVLVEPHVLFFQATVEPFDVPFVIEMAIGRAPMLDA